MNHDQNMRRHGNTISNRTYNPQNTKPSMPLDVDEVDSVLEKFIKQKYDQQLLSGKASRPAIRNDTGNTSSTRSSDDQPPPLPPKPGRRFGFGFGFRSASAALPASNNSNLSSPRSPDGFNSPPSSPLRANKQSRVFGASVGGSGDDIEGKMAQLRDMGFTDEKRNMNVLKGHGGNLERTIESLVRLGEGSGPNSRSRTPLQTLGASTTQPLRSSTPVTAGAYVVTNTPNAKPSQSYISSSEPQNSQTAAPPPEQPTRNFSPNNPYQTHSQPYNPFGLALQQFAGPGPPLEQAFQNMQLSQPQSQQPLFPNATGGYPSQLPMAQDPRSQTMTPPIQQVPQQSMQPPGMVYNPFMDNILSQNQNVSVNPYQQNPQSQQAQGYNPFQQPFQTGEQSHINGYGGLSQQMFSPSNQAGDLQQQAVLQPQPFAQTQQPAPQQQQQAAAFVLPQHSFTNPVQYQAQIQSSYAPQFQPQPLQPQQTGRLDKSSILSLYNYPQLAPPLLPNTGDAQTSAEPQQQALTTPSQLPGTTPKAAQRSVTMPVQTTSGSNNPFQSRVTTPQTNGMSASGPSRHVSQESVEVGAYQSGRHSPDAFASLSARFMR